MNSNTYLQNRAVRTGRTLYAAIVLVTACAACREEVIHTVPTELLGTTWKFDDFYISFVSESAINFHGEDAQDIFGEGTYSIIEGFIEVTMDERVRAGSWNGERLIIDGMVGRLTNTAIE